MGLRVDLEKEKLMCEEINPAITSYFEFFSHFGPLNEFG